MIDEGKLHDQYRNGAAADAELRQTAEAFRQLREEYVKAWAASDPRDDKGREKLWMATTILTRVESHLTQVVTNGKLAAKELDRLRKAGEPEKKKILGII